MQYPRRIPEIDILGDKIIGNIMTLYDSYVRGRFLWHLTDITIDFKDIKDAEDLMDSLKETMNEQINTCIEECSLYPIDEDDGYCIRIKDNLNFCKIIS